MRRRGPRRRHPVSPASSATVLWLLLLLFVLRVLGQVVVMIWAPRWLPPPPQWYSGLIAYPYLLGFQLLFIAAMSQMILGLHPGTGLFGPPSAAFATFCIAFSIPYYGFMVYRWIFRVLRNPERRWYDTLIPIVFHCVLATFLLVYGLGGISAGAATG
jgi:hypothetical protein